FEKGGVEKKFSVNEENTDFMVLEQSTPISSFQMPNERGNVSSTKTGLLLKETTLLNKDFNLYKIKEVENSYGYTYYYNNSISGFFGGTKDIDCGPVSAYTKMSAISIKGYYYHSIRIDLLNT